MNCRAIFECPYGTGSVAREKGRERVKVRGRFGFWVEGTDAKRPHYVPRGAWERGEKSNNDNKESLTPLLTPLAQDAKAQIGK